MKHYGEKTRKQFSLEEIVGAQVYSVWIDTLRRLVPEGRTHRLEPMIAGMLQYATAVATEKYGDNAEEGSTAEKLFWLTMKDLKPQKKT